MPVRISNHLLVQISIRNHSASANYMKPLQVIRVSVKE